ncbi:MAG: PAS domain-containing protein, partial [Proteobacteria bacterium]|nr:PAS domain-containing protein [Pseudomonadota bacterium]
SDASIFEFLQAGSLDGLWYWDLEKPEHEWMNPRFWELMGRDPAAHAHMAAEWQDLIHPDDLATALENFHAHCADSNHPYDQVVRYRHADGSTVWVRCRGQSLELAPVDLRELVEHALTRLRQPLKATGAVVEMGELPEVLGHRDLLTDVVQNLVDNAVKYAVPSPRIRIEGRADDQGFALEVHDDGVGIPVDRQEGIFA